MTVNNRPLHWFTCAIAFCTYLLILAGATVTSHRAGLSVPDWPNTYGHFMFSFPLSKMVGGIFWEHGHRLIASTVGFFTIILAVWLARTEQRPWVKRLGWIALAAVIFQGILGGLTVRFYLPALVSVAHAATAQAFFCLTIALAFFTSRKWTDAATPAPHARMLRWFAVATTVAIYLQLILGATIRHANAAVIAHIIGAVVVLLCVGVTGMAVITAGKRKDILAAAVALTSLVIVQMVLGVVSLVIRVPKHEHGQLAPAEIWWPTAHLAVGALILAVSFHLTLKCFRHLQTTGEKKDLPLRDYLELANTWLLHGARHTATDSATHSDAAGRGPVHRRVCCAQQFS
jgi:cytochrome c oxidase assembly protein subunit 15